MFRLQRQFTVFRQVLRCQRSPRTFGSMTSNPPSFTSPSSTAVNNTHDDTHIHSSTPGYISIEKLKFDTFDATSVADLHDVKEGGYVDIDPTDIKRVIPEGLAGEMNEEFDFASRTSWMVRDTTKFLVRILEEYEQQKNNKGGNQTGAVPPRSYSSRIHLNGLTDRPEWPDAQLKLHYYGAEVSALQGGSGGVHTSTSSSAGHSNKGNGTNPSHADDMVVVRGEGSTVESYVNALHRDGKVLPTKIVLNGPRGVGKSACMNQVVYQARKRGWLCLFVPKGWDQVQSGWYIEPVQGQQSSSSHSNSSSGDADADTSDDDAAPVNALYDNPFMSAEVLRGFWRAHSDKLKSLPITRTAEQAKYASFIDKFRESWNRAKSMPGREKLSFLKLREIVEAEDAFPEQDELDADVLRDYEFGSSFAPQTLDDLVRMGVAFRDLSGQVVGDLVAELRALDVAGTPVLIAVDQYNTWEGPSVYHYKGRPVMGFDLCVPRALHFVSKKKSETERWTMANGLCIASTSLRHPEGRKERYEDHKSSVPLTVRVPCYSQVECLSAVSYYTHQKRIGEGLSTQELLTFRTLTGSNPRDVRTEAVPFFFPLAVARHGMDFMRPIENDSDDSTSEEGDELAIDGGGIDLGEVVDAVSAGTGPASVRRRR